MSLELAFAEMCELVGADVLEGVERTRTADPISLRVYERVRRRDFGIIRDLSGRYPAHSLEDRQWPEPEGIGRRALG